MDRTMVMLIFSGVTLGGALIGNNISAKAEKKAEEKKKAAAAAQQAQPVIAEPAKTVNGAAVSAAPQFSIDANGYWRDANGNMYQLTAVQQPAQQTTPVVVAG